MTMAPSGRRFRAAAVQMRSGRDVETNVAHATALIREARMAGASYVQTPEMTTFMERDRDRLFAAAGSEANAAALPHFRALAKDLGIWLHIGSMAVRRDGGKLANRAFVISPDGSIAARYDKIHLFDVDLPTGESYKESHNYEPGRLAVLARLPSGLLGVTICYDLRFPGLCRALARAGAAFLAVPSAFTRLTGQAHWHTLIRARAIESQCFVFAAAQGGMHEHGRETFGHSLIVSPWGDILAEGATEPGVVVADIDLAALDDVRRHMPCLEHDRPFEVIHAEGVPVRKEPSHNG